MYTLVQHSGVLTEHTEFEHAVESASITETQARMVERFGGLVFEDYSAAEARAEQENYPPGVEGLVPQAPGTFHARRIDQRRIYIPAGP